MNEIILQQRYIKHELKASTNQLSNNALLKKIIVKKFRNAESVLTNIKKPNIKDINSEKRYGKFSERNFIKQPQSSSGKISVGKLPIIEADDDKQIKKETAQHSNRSFQLLTSKRLVDPRQQKLPKTSNKSKQSIRGENKIDNTLPLMKKNISKKLFTENRRQQHGSSLNKSYSCKYRFNTYLINAQQLGQIFKNNQGKQANSIAQRMKNNNKRFYDHSISNLFSMTNKDIMINKVQSEMPEELGIKQITIPQREEKMNKNINQSISTKNNKMIPNRAYEKNKPREKFPYKMRQGTEKANRNRIGTQQNESKQLWPGLQKPFEPWQFERISSNFFY